MNSPHVDDETPIDEPLAVVSTVDPSRPVAERRRFMPTLTALRAFEAAARLRSFKRAADELCVTESSISHQIRGLEQVMGVVLFERLHRRVVLTPEGMAYMLVLTKSFDEIASTTQRILRRPKQAAPQRRRLVLAVEPGLAHYWLRARMASFDAQFGDIALEVVPSLNPMQELADRATLAIHYGWRASGAFHCEEIARTRVFPVCSPRLLTGVETPLDLSRQVLIHDRTLRMWGEWLSAAGQPEVDWQQGPIFHSSALGLQAAIEGEGVALANELIAAEPLRRGQLVKPFELRIDPPGYRWFLVSEASQRDAPEAAEFRAWLLQELDELAEDPESLTTSD